MSLSRLILQILQNYGKHNIRACSRSKILCRLRVAYAFVLMQVLRGVIILFYSVA